MNRTADAYVKQLSAALGDLPRHRREDILDEVRGHIADAVAAGADVPGALDRLGTPDDIAREARARFGLPAPQVATRDYVALILLSAGSLVVPVAGWLVGIVLVWQSSVWRSREKLLATLVFPFGLFPALYALTTPSDTTTTYCTGGFNSVEQCTTTGGRSAVVLAAAWTVVVLSLASLAVVAYLATRARRTVHRAARSAV